MRPDRLSRLLSQPRVPKWRPSLWFLHPKFAGWGPDVLALLALSIAQINILPSVTGGYDIFDIVTPLLVIAAVQLPLPRVLLLGVTAALVFETHGSLPAGFYFCSYGVMMACVIFFRDHISWRQTSAWVTTIAVSCTWVRLFETFVYQVSIDTLDDSPAYWLALFTGIMASIALGMTLVRLLNAGHHVEAGGLP